jgi:hypothetical protein
MQKQATIAETMRVFMATEPAVKDFPNYKALNDAVGAVHGLPAGKCQALAGPKAWEWTPDTVSGRWRKATDVEFESRKQKAAQKNHGTRKSKVLSDADRAALDAQIEALKTVNNPALAGLLADLQARQAADDLARKGSYKDRLAAAVERLSLATAVDILERAIAAAEDAEDNAEDTEDTEDTEDA